MHLSGFSFSSSAVAELMWFITIVHLRRHHSSGRPWLDLNLKSFPYHFFPLSSRSMPYYILIRFIMWYTITLLTGRKHMVISILLYYLLLLSRIYLPQVQKTFTLFMKSSRHCERQEFFLTKRRKIKSVKFPTLIIFIAHVRFAIDVKKLCTLRNVMCELLR